MQVVFVFGEIIHRQDDLALCFGVVKAEVAPLGNSIIQASQLSSMILLSLIVKYSNLLLRFHRWQGLADRAPTEFAGQKHHPAQARAKVAQELKAEWFGERGEDGHEKIGFGLAAGPAPVEMDRPEVKGEIDDDLGEYKAADRDKRGDTTATNII